MIVDQDMIVSLAQGTDRRIIQEGDVQTLIPPIVNVVAPATKELTLAAAATTVQNSSFTFNLAQARVNQAAAAFIAATLSKGLWQLDLYSAFWSDWNSAAGTLSQNSLTLNDGVNSSLLITRFVAIGSFVDVYASRVLINKQMTIQLSVPLTGAGQNLSLQVGGTCIRIL